MRILVKFNPQVIHLTGDKEVEAVANYMFSKHGVNIYQEWYDWKNRAMDFIAKYHVKAKLVQHNGITFYYTVFK